MSLPESPDFAHEASQSLQHQLYYSGEILEISFDGLKGYKEQSIAYALTTNIYGGGVSDTRNLSQIS